MPEIVTFHGADGSGKSSIATRLTRILEKHGDAIMIGGSSYKQWLTPQVARETVGSSDVVGANPKTPDEKNQLYEIISVACYGYAHQLVEQGSFVVIDSDPVIKRMLWNHLEEPEQDRRQLYAKNFGAYILKNLPDTISLSLVVGVNMETNVSEHDIRNRLDIRGGNSEYDPQTLDETRMLCEAATALWHSLTASLSGQSDLPFFNQLYRNSSFITVANPNYGQANLDTRLQEQAARIGALLQ